MTETSVKQLFAVMTQSYDTSIIDKKDSQMMQFIAKLLDAVKVQDDKAFLNAYAITLGYDIYLPFSPGDSDPSSITQVCACAHEHQHVVVMERIGAPVYSMMYVISPVMRAVYEAECYRADMEVFWWYSKAVLRKPTLLTPRALARQLSAYGCHKEDIESAEKSLEKAAKLVKRGGASCQAAIDVIKFYGWFDAK